MPYRAKVIKVMIASPSDVRAERQIVRHVIEEWNNTHSEDKNLVLMPVGWESHSAPAIGGRPQAIINKQVLADCDLLIAVFWTKVGTPTGKAVSGTVEEIEEHVKAKKPAMVYFSSVPVAPGLVDFDQMKALQEFKSKLRARGLYDEFESPEAFREKLTRQLAQTVIRHFVSKKNGSHVADEPVIPPELPPLSQPAKTLLMEAAQDAEGVVLRLHADAGVAILTNDKNLSEHQDARTAARWEGALRELHDKGLIRDRGDRGNGYTVIFGVTDEGYRVAELLKEQHLVPQ
ncbi:MAG: DUF4062 domain-containing protein [Gemmataceae bacterium]|nr:DUF4062 domain-containing protein [Gemmataceae bacterium]